jgi:hypothetical protein
LMTNFCWKMKQFCKTINAIGIRVKSIEAELIDDKQRDQYTGADPDCQASDVDKAERSVFDKGAEGNL